LNDADRIDLPASDELATLIGSGAEPGLGVDLNDGYLRVGDQGSLGVSNGAGDRARVLLSVEGKGE